VLAPAACRRRAVGGGRQRPYAAEIVYADGGVSAARWLAELERRHRALETEIAEAHAHPSIDDLQIASLKRRKLLVKDELARLRN
jgi:hypothetical protein